MKEYINPTKEMQMEYIKHMSNHDSSFELNDADLMVKPENVEAIMVCEHYTDINETALCVTDKNQIEKILTDYQTNLKGLSEDEVLNFTEEYDYNVKTVIDGIPYNYTYISEEMFTHWKELINEQAT